MDRSPWVLKKGRSLVDLPGRQVNRLTHIRIHPKKSGLRATLLGSLDAQMPFFKTHGLLSIFRISQACFFLLLGLFFVGCAQAPYKEARMLMGTLNEIQIYGLSKERARAAAEKGFAAMKRVDDLMSHYKATSEVSHIKNLPPLELLVVSQETFEVLSRAYDVATLSDGAFDVTVAPLVKRWGFFDHIQKEIPTQEELKELRRKCGYEQLLLNPKTKTVQKRVAGLEVDLGGIAKGYAIDLALAALKEAGVISATVNSGGNLGFIGKPPKHLVWEVGIKDPRNPQEMIGVLTVEKGGVATSGNYEQYFEIEGKRYTHILDPRTGWPIQGIHSVTVIAPNAMDADALSTTLFVLGPEKGIPLAEKFGAQALFILDKGEEKTDLIFSPDLEALFLATAQ